MGAGRLRYRPDCTSVGVADLNGFVGLVLRMGEHPLEPPPPSLVDSRLLLKCLCWVFAFYLKSQ